jgi:DNA-binding XRE family transcriptional regulator
MTAEPRLPMPKKRHRPTPDMSGADFKAHRAILGWTQRNTAQALGLTVENVASIENGRATATKTAALLFRLYRFGDWPGRPSANWPPALTQKEQHR